MKKKKLEAKLTKTRKKLAATKTQLDEMLSIMEASGMPKAKANPAAGKTDVAKPATAKSTAKPPAKPKTARAAKTPKKIKAK
jgi:hypothetical protein